MQNQPHKNKAKNGRKIVKTVLWFLAIIFGILFWLWSCLAIRFSNLPWETLRVALAWVFAVGAPAAIIVLPKRKRTFGIIMLTCVGILIWFTLIPASNDRDWVPENSRMPYAVFDGDEVTIYNIRDFDYITENEFKIRYYDRTYDLDELNSIDFVLSKWDNNEAVAHFILSFGFEDGDHLCVSVETRREKGEPQTSLRGLFKQYELLYILASERDLLRLRTNFRKEDVYLYPTTVPPENARKLLTVILEQVNELKDKPAFYNTITHNCLTSLIRDFRKISPPKTGFDIRRLLNGYFDKLAYENGVIKTCLPFEATKKLHHINQYVANNNDSTDYSKKIRPVEGEPAK